MSWDLDKGFRKISQEKLFKSPAAKQSLAVTTNIVKKFCFSFNLFFSFSRLTDSRVNQNLNIYPTM